MSTHTRRTIYLTEREDRFLESMKDEFGSISKIIQYSLERLQKDRLKEYYMQKSEDYTELHKAQQKVIKSQEKEESR